jgi:hypothetical protein
MMTPLKPISYHLVGGRSMTRRTLLAIFCVGTVALWTVGCSTDKERRRFSREEIYRIEELINSCAECGP